MFSDALELFLPLLTLKNSFDSSIRAEMNLTVESESIDCRTPRFKLQLHLPHPVDADAGKAKWDVDAETLTITLPIKREYDFINFR